MAQVGLINTVHFSEFNALFFEGSGRFLVVRSKRLAVPAPSTEAEMLALFCYNEKRRKKKGALPWRKEFDKDKFLGVDHRLEIGGSQIDYVGGRLCNGESGESERDKRSEGRRKAHPVADKVKKRLTCDRAYLSIQISKHETS